MYGIDSLQQRAGTVLAGLLNPLCAWCGRIRHKPQTCCRWCYHDKTKLHNVDMYNMCKANNIETCPSGYLLIIHRSITSIDKYSHAICGEQLLLLITAQTDSLQPLMPTHPLS